MMNTVERKEELLKEAEKLAEKLCSELRKIEPKGESPGKHEFLLVFHFFIRKKSCEALKKLFQFSLPKRSGKTPMYWEVLKNNLEPLADKFNEGELSYILGWTGRLLEYEFAKQRR
jgi:hypothetical protein